MFAELNVEDTGFVHADYEEHVKVKPVRDLGFGEVRQRAYFKDAAGRINEVEGTPEYLGHHKRMMEATKHLREKASWAKTKKSPAPKST